MINRTEVAVVGAGPIGLELAVALKRRGMDYIHFDAKQIGYTISWFPPQTRFFSSNERIAIAGVPLQTPDQNKATREHYLAYLRGIVQQFDLRVNTYEPVVGIEQKEGGFAMTTRPASGARSYWARKLVLATGGTDHPRRLNVPGEELPHVSHYFQDAHTYFGKRLLIVGGKNSAVEAALRCYQAGAHVSLSYRRSALPEKSIKYWLLPEIRGLIESGKMPAYFGTVPTEITATSVRLAASGVDQGTRGTSQAAESYLPPPVLRGRAGEGVASSSARPDQTPTPTLPRSTGRGDKERAPAKNLLSIEADFVLALIGYEQDNTLLRLAGVELRGDCGAPVFDEKTMQTNIPGLYVAGTAVGGTQEKYTVFIENCHVHVDRIIASLTGAAAPQAPPAPVMPES
jgi:thioredoxin reductase (NADPH)